MLEQRPDTDWVAACDSTRFPLAEASTQRRRARTRVNALSRAAWCSRAHDAWRCALRLRQRRCVLIGQQANACRDSFRTLLRMQWRCCSTPGHGCGHWGGTLPCSSTLPLHCGAPATFPWRRGRGRGKGSEWIGGRGGRKGRKGGRTGRVTPACTSATVESPLQRNWALCDGACDQRRHVVMVPRGGRCGGRTCGDESQVVGLLGTFLVRLILLCPVDLLCSHASGAGAHVAWHHKWPEARTRRQIVRVACEQDRRRRALPRRCDFPTWPLQRLPRLPSPRAPRLRTGSVPERMAWKASARRPRCMPSS